jgi:hypothetical protein
MNAQTQKQTTGTKHILRLGLTLLLLVSTRAGAGYTLSVTADRPDAIYQQGETVTFTLKLQLDQQPVEGAEVRWTITKDGVPPTTSGTVKLAGGRATVTGRLNEPGFLLCRANGIAVVNGNGKTIWERGGNHFESIDVGRVIAERAGPQILVDIDHQPLGKGPLWLLDENGAWLGRINADYARLHDLLDWNGDGFNEIVNAHSGAVYDNQGRRIATLAAPPAAKGGERSILVGDFTGDGVPDVALITTTAVHIFRNESGAKPAHRVGLGTEFNFTLY